MLHVHGMMIDDQKRLARLRSNIYAQTFRSFYLRNVALFIKELHKLTNLQLFFLILP